MSATVRLLSVLLLTMAAGCISVPTDQSFKAMEASTTANLDDVSTLVRIPPGQSDAPAMLRGLLATNLTVDAAVRIALSNNRRIQAQYERLDLAAAERLAARLLKNPEAAGAVKISEEDSDEEVIEIGVEIDALHMLLLPKYRRIGEAEFAAVEMEVIQSVQSLAYDTRVAYYRVLAAQQQLEMRRSVLQAAEAAAAMADRLREAGNIRQLDQLNQQALHEQALLGVSTAELALNEAREDLNVLMGLQGPDTSWTVGAGLPLPGPEPTLDAVETNAVQNSLQLAITQNKIRAAAARLGIAKIESVMPTLHAGVEAEREPNGEWMAGPMIAVEIPIFNFGQARRPAAEAALRSLQQEYAAQAVEIASMARKVRQRVLLSTQRVEAFQERLVPLQEQILHRTQLQYNAMQLGVFQLLQAKQMEIATQTAYINELLNYWIVRTELEQIRNGLPVNSAAPANQAGGMSMDTAGNGGH